MWGSGVAFKDAACCPVSHPCIVCQVCPPGCDPALYEAVVELREHRLDEEEAAAEVSKAVEALGKDKTLLSKKAKLVDTALAAINQVCCSCEYWRRGDCEHNLIHIKLDNTCRVHIMPALAQVTLCTLFIVLLLCRKCWSFTLTSKHASTSFQQLSASGVTSWQCWMMRDQQRLLMVHTYHATCQKRWCSAHMNWTASSSVCRSVGACEDGVTPGGGGGPCSYSHTQQHKPMVLILLCA